MEKMPFNVRLKLKREKKRQFDLDLPNSNAEQFSHLQAPKPVNLLWRMPMQSASGQGS